jgi:hypothetical protein
MAEARRKTRADQQRKRFAPVIAGRLKPLAQS